MDYLTGDPMAELGIPANNLGSRVPGRGHATFDQREWAAHPAGHATQGGTRAMIHDLTIGHLDPDAIADRQAVALRPLDASTVARVFAEFPDLKVEWLDGYLVVPWHGREDAERGEAFAARMQAETGC